MIKVETDSSAFEKASRMLREIPNGVERATVSAFNRALLEGRTAGTREATKHYTLKAGIVRKTMAMHRASRSNLNAELVSRGRRLPMKYYAHKPSHDTTGANRKQVSVGIRKGSLKPLGQAFIYNGMVMQRLGATRLPIEQKYSLAVPNILNNDEVIDAIQERMSAAVEKRIEHETQRLLAGYGK